jgi:hypothetical protein
MNDSILILLDISILILSSIGLLTSITILCLVSIYRRRAPISSSIFLSCNTYPAIVMGSLAIIDMYAHNLYGDIYKNVSFDNWWCYVRFYLLLVAFCSIYQSYLLQACFHLFRVVFYKFKQLRNVRFLFRLVVIQWTISFLIILPAFVFDHFEYLPEYYHCQIVFSNPYGLILVSLPIYYLPMLAIGTIYIYIICYTRRKTRSIGQRHRRQSSNRRDIIVLRRITILVGLLWTLTFPFMILWLVYIITGYLYPLSYHFQWLTFAISLLVLPFASASLTPQLRKLLRTVRFTWNTSSQLSNDCRTEIVIDLRYSLRDRRSKLSSK